MPTWRNARVDLAIGGGASMNEEILKRIKELEKKLKQRPNQLDLDILSLRISDLQGQIDRLRRKIFEIEETT